MNYLDKRIKRDCKIRSEKTICVQVPIMTTYMAFRTYRGNVMIYYWICDKELFDATGFSADDIKNIRDLTPVLAKLKEQNENIVPIATESWR